MNVLGMILAIALAQGIGTDEYNRAGVAINDTLHALEQALDRGASVEPLLDPSFTRLIWGTPPRLTPDSRGLGVGQWSVGVPVADGRSAAAALLSRSSHPGRERSIFKLLDIERIDADGTAHAVLRFEVQASGRVERGRFRGTFGPDTRRLRTIELLEADTAAGPGNLFRDRAQAAGLDYYGAPDARFLPPSTALKFQSARHSIGGVSIGDVNGDDADDVLMFGGEAMQLFVNRGDGTFRDQTKQAGLGGVLHVNVAVFADFDNDGDQDLFAGLFYGRNRLFENLGGGRFKDVTAASGLAADDVTSVASVIDYDNDGNLDLYIGRWLDMKTNVPDMIHYTRNGEANILYRGRGDLTFGDESAASGTDDVGLTLGIAAADYDLDGDQDMYLANDFGRNVLLNNQGDGTFRDLAKQAGAMAISGGMSASFGDYDGDGWLDIYVSSVASNQRWFSRDLNIRSYVLNLVQSNARDSLQHTFLDLRAALGDAWQNVGQYELAGNYLLRNRGDGTFEDVSVFSGTRQFGWYWGAGFFDADNDGSLDIYAVNGWITGKKDHDL